MLIELIVVIIFIANVIVTIFCSYGAVIVGLAFLAGGFGPARAFFLDSAVFGGRLRDELDDIIDPLRSCIGARVEIKAKAR